MTRDGRRQAEEWRCAIHESAHACIAVALGLSVWQVGILFDEAVPDEGLCWLDSDGGTVSPFVSTLYKLAGGAAEARLGIAAAAIGDAADRALAARTLATRHGLTVDHPRIEDLLQRCAVLASAHVAQHWCWIERVAHEMMRRRVLTGDDVQRLRPPSLAQERADMNTNDATLAVIKALDREQRAPADLTAFDRRVLAVMGHDERRLHHKGRNDDNTPRTLNTLTESEQRALIQGLKDKTISIADASDLVPDEPFEFTYRELGFLHQMNENNMKRNEKIAALERQVAALEQRPTLSYEGVWQQTTPYTPGQFVTFNGSVWHCEAPSVGVRPGSVRPDMSPAWKLAVKCGQDLRKVPA
jgi:hypothetical protein